MTLDQLILLITACISLLAVFVTFLSVIKMGKQVEIQKNQWEYSQKPIFRVIKTQKFRDQTILIIENSNSIFHIIESVTFTTSDVISNYSQGSIGTTSSKDGNEVIAEGWTITLTPLVNTFIEGIVQIRGKDILGNSFICNSKPIKFENRSIINSYDFYKVYFKFM